MERNWKKTLVSGLLAVVLMAALVIAGGSLKNDTTVQDDTIPQSQQIEDPGNSTASSVDPNDPSIVGERDAQSGAAGTTGTAGGQDQYHTDSVPEGKPLPVEPDDAVVDTGTSLTCTFSISCATILDNMDQLTSGKEGLVPSDGVILPATRVTFSPGESVFDVLQRVCRENRIHMESSFTPMYNSHYIEGINNLYEFDVGSESGWMYSVNGWFPNYGCSRYQLEDGDTVCWVYTCDLGYDVGGGYMGG